MTAVVAPTAGHPPSDGAHRLAWWLADGGDRRARVAQAVGSDALIERLLTGAVEPADEISDAIGTATAGAVRPEDWLRGGPLGWGDRPFERI
jgi:hypothetical protein